MANVKRMRQGVVKLGSFGLTRPQDSGLLAMVVAASLISWFVITNHDPAPAVARVTPVLAERSAPATSSSQSTSPRPTSPRRGSSLVIAPVALTARGLKTAAASLGQAVFWVGEAPGFRYELSRSSTGDVLVRYLPLDAKVGERRQFLTVGTYPFPNAFATAQAGISQGGIRWQRIANGGLASYRQAEPHSVYLAFPNLDYRIQVFDPSAAQARGLVASGRVRPVG